MVSGWRRTTDGDERRLDLDYLLQRDGSPKPLFAMLPVFAPTMSSSTQSRSCPAAAAALRIKSSSSTVAESRSSANSSSALWQNQKSPNPLLVCDRESNFCEIQSLTFFLLPDQAIVLYDFPFATDLGPCFILCFVCSSNELLQLWDWDRKESDLCGPP